MVHLDQQDWTTKVLMVEFTLNSAISNSSGFALFELNYGYMPSVNPGFIPEPSTVPGVKHFVMHALHNLMDVHNVIIESCMCQTHNANYHHCEDDFFMAGNLVYVLAVDLSLPKGCTAKLLLKYVGPFRVLNAQLSTSSYWVELPT
jgi:hypothetical protein